MIKSLEDFLKGMTPEQLEFLAQQAIRNAEARRCFEEELWLTNMNDFTLGTHKGIDNLLQRIKFDGNSAEVPDSTKPELDSHNLQKRKKVVPINPDEVYKAADKIHEKHGVVTTRDIQLYLGTTEYGAAIGRHLSILAHKLKLNPTDVTRKPLYDAIVAFFQGRKRPQLLGEKVYDYVRGKDCITHADIKEITGLPDIGVELLMVKYLGYKPQGTIQNRHYIFG